MKLSVIIPNYNNDQYLRKCIDSILEQTFLPNEIIIVDDNSTDCSVSLIREYERKYNFIRGIYLDENMGVSYARDIGILNSNSDYITVIDSDDFYYNNNKLENEMKLINEYKRKYNKDIISYSKTKRVDEQGINLGNHNINDEYYYFEGNITLKLLSEFKVQCMPRDYCFKKEIYIKSGGYNKQMNLYEDLDLLVRLSNISEFYCTREYGTAYRQTGVGLSSRAKEQHIQAKSMIYKKYITLLPIKERIVCNIFKKLLWARRKLLRI